jgi:hypothetical protein
MTTEIYTNCRGWAVNGEPFDGHLDGWSWHAWSGPFIAYGSTEERAVANLIAKMQDGSGEKRPYGTEVAS